MTLLRLTQVSKQLGSATVLDGVTLQIEAGDKVGFIGANGAGKTTALRIADGSDQPSSGTRELAADATLAVVPQHLDAAADERVIDVAKGPLRQVEERLRAEEERLAAAPDDRMEQALRRYQRVRDRYDALGGDEADPRAQRALQLVGLTRHHDQLAGELSGGERNLLALARAITQSPDIMLLDEPGNHLDFRGLALLERLLVEFAGAVLLVSHNRYLLDHCTSRTVELAQGRIHAYAGNYSAYRSQKLRDAIARQSDYLANQKRLASLEALVKRFEQIARATADPAWGKRLRARRSQLQRERQDAVPEPTLGGERMQLQLEGPAARADIALRLQGYHKRYDDTVLFENAAVDIRMGDRVALVGGNGTGKSSLLNDVVAHGSWDDDTIRLGPSVRLGYCPQHQEVLDDELTLIDTLRNLAPLSRDEAFAILTRFLFVWDDMQRQVGELSGGERNRLQLARLLVLRPNLLILDEPTNHLDIHSREAVEEGLEDYDGTLLVVSHDRYLLERLVDRVVWVGDKKLHTFDGSFAEYWAAYGSRTAAGSEADDAVAARIASLEGEKQQLEQAIEQAFAKRDRRRGRTLGRRLQAVEARLQELTRAGV